MSSCADVAANRSRSGRSATTCSSPTTTSSATTSPTATSDPTGNTSATRPNTGPAGCNASLKRSATRSTSNNPNPLTATSADPRQPADPLAGSPLPEPRATSGIHRPASGGSDSERDGRNAPSSPREGESAGREWSQRAADQGPHALPHARAEDEIRILQRREPRDFSEEQYERDWSDRVQPEQLSVTGRRGLGMCLEPALRCRSAEHRAECGRARCWGG